MHLSQTNIAAKELRRARQQFPAVFESHFNIGNGHTQSKGDEKLFCGANSNFGNVETKWMERSGFRTIFKCLHAMCTRN